MHVLLRLHSDMPPWLSWQSARLLTDRSLVRAQVEAYFLGFSEIPVCQSGLADLYLGTTVFHLLTCLELYEGVKKFHPNLSERAGFGGAPGLTACRVANLTSTAIERTKLDWRSGMRCSATLEHFRIGATKKGYNRIRTGDPWICNPLLCH